MKEFKYKTRFVSTAKILVPAKEDKFLALASLQSLKSIFSNINPQDYEDILFIAGNLSVANVANKNGDCVTGFESVGSYKLFERKFIDIEHDRNIICGYIDRAGLSSFGSNEVISAEDASNLGKDPFNVFIGGVIWKTLAPGLADYLIMASDEGASEFGTISFSFEVGFNSYKIAFGPTRFLSDATIVESEDDMSRYSKMLQCNGGNGKDENGNYVFRILTGELLPLGCALVTKPAAFVEGITSLAGTEEKPKEVTDSAKKEPKESEEIVIVANTTTEPIKTSEEKISQNNKPSVILHTKDMKLEKIADIETNWAELRANETGAGLLTRFIADEIAKESVKFSDSLKEKEAAAKAAADAAEQAKTEHAQTAEELRQLKEKMDQIEAAQKSKENEDKFNERMSAFDAEYNFSKEENEVIAKDIRDMEDSAFEDYRNKVAVLAKEKSKVYAANKQAELESLKGKNVKVVDKDGVLSFEEVIASAKREDATLPNDNSGDAPQPSLKDAMASAFAGKIKINGKTLKNK